MKDQLVSFETAKLAKEKGFDGFCFDAYNTHKMKYSDGWLEYIDDNEIEIPFTSESLKSKDILAPTQSLLQKWLREVHNIVIDISLYILSDSYYYSVHHDVTVDVGEHVYDTYEEALEAGLIEALNLIQQQ